MKTINDYSGPRESLADYGVHGVGKVHGHFLYSPTNLFGYSQKTSHNLFGRRTPDDSRKRTTLPFASLVGEESEEIVAEHRLVYAHPLTKVLFQEHPVGSVRFLLPFFIVAQMVLVGTFQTIPVRLEEATNGTGRHRVRIQELLLKKQRTLRCNLCRRRRLVCG